MSSADDPEQTETNGNAPVQSGDDSGDQTAAERLAQLEQLRTENRRLRQAYAATQQTRYRRTALGLYVLGSLSVGAAVVFPDARSVLFALGATGLFAGLLTYYLTPEQFVSAHVSERIATAHAATLQAMIVDLGLQETAVYVPLTTGEGNSEQLADVLLFVPQATAYDLPPAPTPGLVTPDNRQARGLLAVPTGGTLLREFERTIEQPLSTDPDRLAEQLADGLTEQFELAEAVRTETAPVTDDEALDLSPGSDLRSEARGATRMVVRVEAPTIEPGPVDDPYTSFVGAGVANALEIPVEVADRPSRDDTTYQFALVWERVDSDASSE